MAPRVRHLDAASLKLLAHPLRVRIVGTLRAEGPATATSLGERLGESSGLTSYHLRALADAGFVEDAADHPTSGRERWWRAVDEMTSWRPSDVGDDPDSQAAEEWLTGFTARRGMTWLDEWLRRRADAPAEWREASETDDYVFQATPDELRQLMAELDAVVRRRLGREPAPGRVTVRVLLSAFPADPLAQASDDGPVAGDEDAPGPADRVRPDHPA